MTATKLFAASTAALIVACVAGWAASPPAKPVLPRPQRSRLIHSK